MSTPPPRTRIPLPTGRGWWLVGAGLAAGLALFLMLWMGQRAATPYPDGEQAPSAAMPVFRPLPTPPAAGMAGAADIPIPDGAARIDEPEPAPPMAEQQGNSPLPPHASSTTAIPASTSSPVPIESPGPDYPARALRRGESGEVLLRIHVDARGIPARVEVASSSGSKDLDRAATRAVQRWRFRPAMHDGTPVAGEVNVPISFAARR